MTTHGERHWVLDDLDVRASDLLQTNCVIWVEGPTDRLYFNRWVDLWTGGELKEGIHYQCVFYGGRLLNHLSGDVSDISPSRDSGVRLLNVNRHAVALIDSDRADSDDEINRSKHRLCEEIKKVGGLAWVTAGREIENYLPRQALQGYFSDEGALGLGSHEPMSKYLKARKHPFGRDFKRFKIKLAEDVRAHITRGGLASVLDLRERLEEVTGYIRKCNHIVAKDG